MKKSLDQSFSGASCHTTKELQVCGKNCRVKRSEKI